MPGTNVRTIPTAVKKNIDFLVTAVDNFGDTGFALDLAESVLSERPDWTVRFFSDDRELFERLSARRPHAKVPYFELSGYGNIEPSETIVSFFDRKLPEAHFAKYAFPKKILQISYLRFDADSADRPGVGSLNGTRYRIGGDEVVHLVPSPLPEGAGVVVRKGASGQVPVPGFPNFSERHLTSFDS
ncbi:MAG: Protein-arginine rhamnosyltransferase [Patescibacteria group bacterium]|nr:Protein-arginine rhamnosyltransferase [Patescibacteria group bacterium]